MTHFYKVVGISELAKEINEYIRHSSKVNRYTIMQELIGTVGPVRCITMLVTSANYVSYFLRSDGESTITNHAVL